MSESLVSQIALQIISTLSGSPAVISTTTDSVSQSIGVTTTNGTGANQANKVYRERRTLASSSNEDINMYSFGGTLSPLGVAYTLSKVLAILIKNRATASGDNLVIGGKGTSAAWTSPFGSNAHTVTIRPGGYLLMVAPDATGYAVVNTTNHLLKIANSSGANSVDYDLIIIGAQ